MDRIYVSEKDKKKMLKIDARKRAARILLKTAMRQVNSLIAIEKSKDRNMWNKWVKEHNLDVPKYNYVYSPHEGVIEKREETTPENIIDET